MEPSFSLPSGLTKPQQYEYFLSDYRLFIEGESDAIAILSNTSAALREAFGFFWVGFYLVKSAEWLSLGPFQGSVACARIKRGRGVCGTAWEKGHTLVIPDINVFPGHIACSSLSRSEIVVPMVDRAGVIRGVLDIDSDRLSAFDEVDCHWLERIVDVLCQQIY